MTIQSDASLLPHHRLRAYGVAVKLLLAVREAGVRDRVLRDQALRAAKSACLNCAEGAGRVTRADKARGEMVEAVAAIEIAALSGEASQRCRESSRSATSCAPCSRNSFGESKMEIKVSRHPAH
jgi:four helix bundle protein